MKYLLICLMLVGCNAKPTNTIVIKHDTCYLTKTIYKDTCRNVKTRGIITTGNVISVNQTGGQTANNIIINK